MYKLNKNLKRLSFLLIFLVALFSAECSQAFQFEPGEVLNCLGIGLVTVQTVNGPSSITVIRNKCETDDSTKQIIEIDLMQQFCR